MKIYFTTTLFFVLSVLSQRKHKLVGRYNVIPNIGQSYFIDICDSTYIKHFKSGQTARGVIEYGENYTYLRDYEREWKVVGLDSLFIDTKKLKEQNLISLTFDKGKSIKYCQHVYHKDGPVNWLDVCVASGKLIRIDKDCR